MVLISRRTSPTEPVPVFSSAWADAEEKTRAVRASTIVLQGGGVSLSRCGTRLDGAHGIAVRPSAVRELVAGRAGGGWGWAWVSFQNGTVGLLGVSITVASWRIGNVSPRRLQSWRGHHMSRLLGRFEVRKGLSACDRPARVAHRHSQVVRCGDRVAWCEHARHARRDVRAPG